MIITFQSQLYKTKYKDTVYLFTSPLNLSFLFIPKPNIISSSISSFWVKILKKIKSTFKWLSIFEWEILTDKQYEAMKLKCCLGIMSTCFIVHMLRITNRSYYQEEMPRYRIEITLVLNKFMLFNFLIESNELSGIILLILIRDNCFLPLLLKLLDHTQTISILGTALEVPMFYARSCYFPRWIEYPFYRSKFPWQ